MSRDAWRASGARLYANRGTDLPQTKLKPDDVLAIREAKARRDVLRKEINDTLSNKALAARFGVHESTIEKALAIGSHAHVR